MRIIELKYAESYYIDHKGCNCHFKKGVPQQVPDQLADKLLATGDFVDIIMDDPVFDVPVDTPSDPVKEQLKLDPVNENTVPIAAVEDLVNKDFNKLEIATDLKKSEVTIKKRKRRKKEK